MPLLTGGGSVVVGAAAIWVARRSHRLAEDVRADEKKRADEAARERHRDQLFRTVEPAVAALLSHRDSIGRPDAPGVVSEPSPVPDVMSRLNFVSAVANEEEQDVIAAVIEVYGVAVKASDPKVKRKVLASLSVALPRLLVDDQDPKDLARKIRSESKRDQEV